MCAATRGSRLVADANRNQHCGNFKGHITAVDCDDWPRVRCGWPLEERKYLKPYCSNESTECSAWRSALREAIQAKFRLGRESRSSRHVEGSLESS
jgi:hypothetical protein